MKSARRVSLLFLLAHIFLAAALYWGGTIYYSWQLQRTKDDIESIIKSTAIKLQEENMIINNFAKLITDSNRNDKLAFAAGMTGNAGKMQIWFDEDQLYTRKTIEKQNYKAKQRKRKVDEVVNVDARFLKDRNIKYIQRQVKDIHYFDSVFKYRLDSSVIRIDFKIRQINAFGDLRRSHVYSSPSFIINFYDPKIFRVDYTILKHKLLINSWPYITLSSLLFILFFISYKLLVRSYRFQSEMHRFRESLFSNITHELKTPLSSLQIILGPPRHDEGSYTIDKQHLDFARSELTRMKLLVDKIISFGRMNQEQVSLNKSVVNLNDIVREAIIVTTVTAAQSDAIIDSAYATEKISIVADKTLLINAIATIIDNGLKYNRIQPVISIHIYTDEQVAIIKITDNGIGIESKYYNKIFDPFFRIPTGNLYETKGDGLGLSYAKQVMKFHNGDISVLSDVHKGSTFILSLPI